MAVLLIVQQHPLLRIAGIAIVSWTDTAKQRAQRTEES